MDKKIEKQSSTEIPDAVNNFLKTKGFLAIIKKIEEERLKYNKETGIEVTRDAIAGIIKNDTDIEKTIIASFTKNKKNSVDYYDKISEYILNNKDKLSKGEHNTEIALALLVYYFSNFNNELLKQELAKVKKEKDKLLKQLEKKNKPGKYKRSGHLTDQILKYNYPKDAKGQLSIFDSLEEATKKAIETVGGVEVTEIVEGIKLSSSETKVIDCLCKLLHENSQTLEPKKEDYYSGNKPAEINPETNKSDVLINYAGVPTTASKLAITLYSLAKEYKGGEAVNGKDVENVSKILLDLSNKKFLLKYKEETKIKNGNKRVQELEMYHSILSLPNYRDTLYNKEGVELSKREETLIVLHPIFKRQINSKFILYPDDINKRTIIANGGHKIPEITLRLRDYLLRLHSSPRMSREINLDRLYYLLSEKYMKENRKGKVKQELNKALNTSIVLGLLLDYKIEPGATGEDKIIFTLNKNF
jgi:hypothetical protein